MTKRDCFYYDWNSNPRCPSYPREYGARCDFFKKFFAEEYHTDKITPDCETCTFYIKEMRNKPTVKLVGADGNAFAIIGAVRNALRKAGQSQEEIELFTKEATEGDYNNLLRVVMKWVEVE